MAAGSCPLASPTLRHLWKSIRSCPHRTWLCKCYCSSSSQSLSPCNPILTYEMVPLLLMWERKWKNERNRVREKERKRKRKKYLIRMQIAYCFAWIPPVTHELPHQRGVLDEENKIREHPWRVLLRQNHLETLPSLLAQSKLFGRLRMRGSERFGLQTCSMKLSSDLLSNPRMDTSTSVIRTQS